MTSCVDKSRENDDSYPNTLFDEIVPITFKFCLQASSFGSVGNLGVLYPCYIHPRIGIARGSCTEQGARIVVAYDV